MKRKRRRVFTLVELVAVLVIMALLSGLAVVTLRGESPAQQLQRVAMEFQAFCARARFQAMEMSSDRVVYYSPQERLFEVLEPEAEAASDVVRLNEEIRDPSVLTWVMPEEFVCREAEDAEETPSGRLAVFRFFPDGGASGQRKMIFLYKNLTKVVEIGMLTGVSRIRDANDEEIGVR